MVTHVEERDLARMRDHLFFDEPGGSAKVSRFWALLVLASCIASAGVIGDSTATVIGAMIVAPLMTPIMGTVLAIMTGDRRNLIRSVLFVVGGAAIAVLIGYLFGVISPVDITASTNGQVASRVNPRLIDLLAAVATGAAGAFAQCREDVSDTLPGVAIAISLVPPLSVVGITMEAAAFGEAERAVLLFVTNVAAILLTGVGVMTLFGVHHRAAVESGSLAKRGRPTAAIAALVIALAVPLGRATVSLTQARLQEQQVGRVAEQWVQGTGWSIVRVQDIDRRIEVVAAGDGVAPEPERLRRLADDAGLSSADLTVRLLPEQRTTLDGS